MNLFQAIFILLKVHHIHRHAIPYIIIDTGNDIQCIQNFNFKSNRPMKVTYHNTQTGQIETGTVRENFTRGMAISYDNRGQKHLHKVAKKAVAGKRLTQGEFNLLSK